MKDHLAMAQGVLEDTVRLRRILHQHPELSGEEHKTLALIRSELDSLGIPYVTYENGGICAMIGKGERAIGLRADIDALPIAEETGLPYASENAGVMHACGHDMHTAILLGLARLFKGAENELPGMVKLFFQPAEETIGGAKVMVDGGCMQNVEAVLALHVDPTLPVGSAAFLPGKMNAAVIDLDITVRVLDMETAKQVKTLIRQIAQNTAAAFGAEAEVVLTDDYPALTNDTALTQMMAQEARKWLGDEQVIIMDAPSMGADDFAYFSNAAKGCYFNIGTRAAHQSEQALHSNVFAPDEGCIRIGLALLSAGVWKWMEENA